MYPDQHLLQRFPSFQEVKLKEITYFQDDGSFLCGIQLTFTNGLQTPVVGSDYLKNHEVKNYTLAIEQDRFIRKIGVK